MQLYKPSDIQHDMDMDQHAERIEVNSLYAYCLPISNKIRKGGGHRVNKSQLRREEWDDISLRTYTFFQGHVRLLATYMSVHDMEME